jgi:hypothetical protein
VTVRAASDEAIERGRDALARGGWDEARVCFEHLRFVMRG